MTTPFKHENVIKLAGVLGGYLADRFLGTHRALLIGGFIIAAGHFILAIPAVPTFFLGLALVAIGTGLFKTNAATRAEAMSLITHPGNRL